MTTAAGYQFMYSYYTYITAYNDIVFRVGTRQAPLERVYHTRHIMTRVQ